MNDFAFYPKEPFIGVDCSGQPNSPPMIAVATRWTRRRNEHKWIVKISAAQIAKHHTKRDWQGKLYASLIFKAVDEVLQPNFVIHIDEDYQSTRQQRKIVGYLKYLIGSFHSGDPAKENPEIFIKTKRDSKYVNDAHIKHQLASAGKMRIDEKTGLDHLMKLLEDK